MNKGDEQRIAQAVREPAGNLEVVAGVKRSGSVWGQPLAQ